MPATKTSAEPTEENPEQKQTTAYTRPRTLTDALAALDDLRASIEPRAKIRAAELAGENLKAAEARITELETQLTTERSDSEKKVTDLESKLANVPEALVIVTRERDAALHRADLSERNVGLLEGLCGVRGVDPAAAVRIETDPPAKGLSVAEAEARYRTSQTQEERQEIREALEKAAEEKRLR